MSEKNLNDSGSSADDDNGMEFSTKDSAAGFGSSGFVIERTTSVTINKNTMQVEGWDHIWALIAGEE